MIQNDTKKVPLKLKQQLFVKSYIDNGGNISKACEDVGIIRMTYYRWLMKPKFKEMYDDSIEQHNDLIFQRILKLALDSDKEMLKFWARTQMKHRGFVEKQEIEHSGGTQIIFQEVTKTAKEIKDAKKKDNSDREAKRNP